MARPQKKVDLERRKPGKRGLWEGFVSFGLINIPAQVISATRSEGKLHFRLLDRRDNGPVGYQQINKNTKKAVARGDVVKGYEYERGQFVQVTAEDFARANPRATRSIDIRGFVGRGEIQPFYFQRPYLLWPAKNGEKAYALLLRALAGAEKVAIAEMVLSQKQRLCALIPQDGYFLLEALYYAHELEDARARGLVPDLGGIQISPRELSMAEDLIAGMSIDWSPSDYRETYYDDLQRLIKGRIHRGQTQAIDEAESPAIASNVFDLLPLLKQSLKTAQRARRAPRPKAAPASRRRKS